MEAANRQRNLSRASDLLMAAANIIHVASGLLFQVRSEGSGSVQAEGNAEGHAEGNAVAGPAAQLGESLVRLQATINRLQERIAIEFDDNARSEQSNSMSTTTRRRLMEAISLPEESSPCTEADAADDHDEQISVSPSTRLSTRVVESMDMHSQLL